MADINEMKTFLGKSTVVQLKDQCAQRDLPVTPAKKGDLVNRLGLYLKDHPEDELCKLLGTENVEGEEEEENEENEGADEDAGEPSVEEIVEQVDKHLNEDKVKVEDEDKATVKKEKDDGVEEPMDTVKEVDSDQKPQQTGKEEEISMEGIEEAINETLEDGGKEEKKEEGNEEKDNKEEVIDSSEFIVIDDSESSENKQGKKKVPFKRPPQPDSRILNKYRQIDYRRRTIIVCPILVEDLAHEEIQKLLTGSLETLHYNLSEQQNGSIHVVYNTLDEAAKKLEEFSSFKEGIVMKRLTEDLTKRMVLEEAGVQDKQSRSNASPEKRTLCAHYVPEDTSVEVLRTHFPEVKSFLWARDESSKYQGMVFMEYENEDVADKEWERLRKEKIIMNDQRLWFDPVPTAYGTIGKGNIPGVLSPEKRAQLNNRSQQLIREMNSIMLSPESLATLKQAHKKIEQALLMDKRGQLRVKELQRKEQAKKREEAKTEDKQRNKKTERKPDDKKADKDDGEKKSEDKKSKRPRPSSEERRDSNTKLRQPKKPNRQNRRPQNFQRVPPLQQQRSQGYSRWQDQNPGSQRGLLGMPPQSTMGPPHPQGYNMNQGYGQQNMGGGNRYNPQATANAVSLLVGLSSILGGNMRRQTGGDGYGQSAMGQGGGYRESEEWVGGFNEEPRPKRSRYSDGFGGRRR